MLSVSAVSVLSFELAIAKLDLKSSSLEVLKVFPLWPAWTLAPWALHHEAVLTDSARVTLSMQQAAVTAAQAKRRTNTKQTKQIAQAQEKRDCAIQN